MSYSKFNYDVNEHIKWRNNNNIQRHHYGEDAEYVRDVWIKDKRYKELISYILENWDSGNCDDFIPPLLKALIDQNETQQFKRLWKGIIRYRVQNLWVYADLNLDWTELAALDVSDFNMFRTESYTDTKRAAAFQRKFTLNAIDTYISGLEKLNDRAEINNLLVFRETVYRLHKPKPKKSTDKRKIDDNLFWELIGSSRAASQDQFEFMDRLKVQLEAFYPNEIRNFHKVFLTKFNELNIWDVWALAYIVRRGCGDDEFDYFKAWVITKGQQAFERIKSLNTNQLPILFDEEPQLEEFMYLAEQVYESKTNDIMKPIRIKRQKIRGTHWNENNLNHQFPELCAMFNYAA
jgi:hypothetical protein